MSGEDLRVDVVVPVHNGAAHVAEALESALAQSPAPASVIVVDDASTDDTPAILARFGDRIRVLRREANRGPAAARNAGIRAGSSPLIAFLDSDDVWLPGKLALQVPEFARHPELGLSFTSLYDCDAGLRPLGPPRPVPRRSCQRVFEAFYLEAFPMPPSTVLLRRTALDRAGLFDESLAMKEDFELWLRLTMTAPVSSHPEPLVRRRLHPASLTRRTAVEENLRVEALIYEKCGEAAARFGVPLPMPVAERQALGQRRRLWEFMRWGEPAEAAYYYRALAERGGLTWRERAAWPVYTLRRRLRRLLSTRR